MIDWIAKKNKGEWSESLALLKVLYSPKWHINLGNKEGKITEEYAEIVEIKASEKDKTIYKNIDDEVFSVNDKRFNKKDAEKVFKDFYNLVRDGRGAFLIEDDKIIEFCDSIDLPSKAPADVKADLLFKFIDEDLFEGVSIKSSVGGKPSLVNASAQTLISYQITTTRDFNIFKANPKKQRETQNGLKEISDVEGSVRYVEANSTSWECCIEGENFKKTLTKINKDLPNLIGLLTYYSYLSERRGSSFLFANNGFLDDEKEMFKDFLMIYHSGVTPSKEWDGTLPCKCILDFRDDKIILYRSSETSSAYKDYLFEITAFDTPSSRSSTIIDHVVEKEIINDEGGKEAQVILYLSLNIRMN